MRRSLFGFFLSLILGAGPVWADVTLVDTKQLKIQVAYEQGGQAWLKTCLPKVPPPATRDCESEDDPHPIPMAEFLAGIPLETDSYPRTEAGVRIVKKVFEDATNANQSATAEKAAEILKNLTK